MRAKIPVVLTALMLVLTACEPKQSVESAATGISAKASPTCVNEQGTPDQQGRRVRIVVTASNSGGSALSQDIAVYRNGQSVAPDSDGKTDGNGLNYRPLRGNHSATWTWNAEAPNGRLTVDVKVQTVHGGYKATPLDQPLEIQCPVPTKAPQPVSTSGAKTDKTGTANGGGFKWSIAGVCGRGFSLGLLSLRGQTSKYHLTINDQPGGTKTLGAKKSTTINLGASTRNLKLVDETKDIQPVTTLVRC